MGPQYSVGVVEGVPFTACISGSDIIILDSNFVRIQTITCTSNLETIDCSTDVGKVAASYNQQIVIYEPTSLSNLAKPEYEWAQSAILDSQEPIAVISFNLEGNRLVIGGQTIQLWVINVANSCWQRVWSCQTATSIVYLRYSPDGSLFCSAGKSDRLVKIWHEVDSNFKFSFVYAVHPLPVTGVEWRRTSRYCPKGTVANTLLTSCKDNLSRIWVQTELQQPTLHLGGIIEANFDESIAHWINNKEIFTNRSIEVLLQEMLMKIQSGNSQKIPTTDSSSTSLVDQSDETLRLLFKKWQMSTDHIISVNKSDGSLLVWQVKYLDGEDVGVYRQVRIEKLCCIESAFPHYDATTMSLNITAYSPSAYLEVKRAYLAVTGSSSERGLSKGQLVSPSDILEILSLKNGSDESGSNGSIQLEGSDTSVIESEPSIFIVTQHLSGILGLWKLNFDPFPNLQKVDLVTRITGLPIDPSWLNDVMLIVKYDEADSMLITEWRPEYQEIDEDVDSYRASDLANSVVSILPQYHTKQLVELLAFGKLQQVKAILNHLVGCFVLESSTQIEQTSIMPLSLYSLYNVDEKGSTLLPSFNPKKAKTLTEALTHTHLPGLTNIDQMNLLAVADAVAMFDASPEDIYNVADDDDDGSQNNPGMISANIAIDSLDDRGLRFLTAVRQHIYLTRCLPMKQRNELKAAGIGSHNFIWAFHSETQDELISLIPCVQRGQPEWSELREFGIGWWVKKLEVVKKLIEKVAQSAYRSKQEPLDAALFYLAMKKKTLVCALLRRVSGSDKRLLKLFEQDFSDPANRKKALKNAYALLGKHRFEHAAAFFILAGSIWDAVEVCINNLNDIQLAIILIRLHDSDANLPENLKRLLFTEILGSTRPAHKDAFLRSIAHWKLGDYLAATNTLLENDISETRASVFNFYLYLKDQPLVKNRVIEAAERELELCFSTASAYLDSGCPLLALEVLSRLDTSRAMRLKFKASALILMNELNTLAPDTNDRSQFGEWFKSSMRALNKICSYKLDRRMADDQVEEAQPESSILDDGGGTADDDANGDHLVQTSELNGSEHQLDEAAHVAWIEMNEPILRTMLTYCNLHSATENSLTKVRLELLGLLNKLKNKD